MMTLDEALARTTAEERERSLVITDPRQDDNPIVFANDAFIRTTGYERYEALGRNCRFLQGDDTNPASIDAIRDAIARRVPMTVDILNYRKDGTPFWNRLRIKPVFTEAGLLDSFVGFQNTIEAAEVRPEPLEGIWD